MSHHVLVKDRGGTLETEFLEGQPATCTVSVFAVVDGSLETVVDEASATVDTVSTTLAEMANQGDTRVKVASASGIVVGRLYKIGADGATASENVRVRDVQGTWIHLTQPLTSTHASAATFKGLRVSYDMDEDEADVPWADGYAIFTPATGTPRHEAPIDCALTAFPATLCDMTDIVAELPQFPDMIDPSVDLFMLLRRARDQILKLLGPERVRASLGVSGLRRAAALQAILLCRHGFGETRKPQMDGIAEDLGQELQIYRGSAPLDVDQDGTPNASAEEQGNLNWDMV